jgi:adenine deaminase
VFYNLKNVGAIAPRYWADLVVFDDLQDLRPRLVFKKGALVARDGETLFASPDVEHTFLRGSMNVARFTAEELRIEARGERIRVIEVIPDQIVTRHTEDRATLREGAAVADPTRDLAKFAVIERHRATGFMGLGFVRGFGLQRGALASSVAHDSHNLGVLGQDDADMVTAAERVVALGGGMVAVSGGRIVAELALPVAGLVSDQPLETVVRKVEELAAAARELGCSLPDPFALLSFLSLVPIPELRLTDKGLIDARTFQQVDLFV